MVKFALKLSCTVENINQLYTSDSDFQWNIKLVCRQCNEADNVWHAVSSGESVAGRAGPGSFNFQMKCKFCGNVFTIDVVKDSVKPLKSSDGDKIDRQTAVVFECRGVEPTDFDPQGPWCGKSEESGSKFTDIEFDDDKMWTGYDEKGQVPVSVEVTNVEFVRA